MMLHVEIFAVNPLGTQCYVLSDDTRECVIVDPGMLYPEEHDALDKYISANSLRPVAIWQTHLHFDHCWGTALLKSRYSLPVYASADDEFLIVGNRQMTASWGLPAPDDFCIDIPLTDGLQLAFGHSVFSVIKTPGHTPGGVSFHCAAEKVCLTGDTLFRFSVGRTDFPRGDQSALIDSIRSRLLTLPPDTALFPGHGPQSVVSEEIVGNPYINQYD